MIPKPKAEIKTTHEGIYGIFVNGWQIGTIHFGTETDQYTDKVVHINLQPKFWSPLKKYFLKEGKVEGDNVYLRFEIEK